MAEEKGFWNVAFMCYTLLRRVKDCLEVLIKTGRVSEAALMAHNYAPRCVLCV